MRSCYSGKEPPGGDVGMLGLPYSPSAAASALTYQVSDSWLFSEPEWRGQGRDDISCSLTLHTVQRIFMHIISVNPMSS